MARNSDVIIMFRREADSIIYEIFPRVVCLMDDLALSAEWKKSCSTQQLSLSEKRL